ncbi:MAG: hypothetical protein VX293_09215 [Candidatus Latescibacterota bacterium]|nr:hypothetical protein [Candidatus Latescibacterota bacterium]
MSGDQHKTEDQQAATKIDKGGLKVLFWIFVTGLFVLAGCFEFLVGFREHFELSGKPENGLHLVRHDNGHPLLEGNYKNGQKVGKFTMWHANGMVKKTTYYEDGEKEGTSFYYLKNGALFDSTTYVAGNIHGLHHQVTVHIFQRCL